jgi:hypothetical protein
MLFIVSGAYTGHWQFKDGYNITYNVLDMVMMHGNK